MGGAAISVFLSPLQTLLTYLQRDRQYEDEKKEQALLAIQTALIQTLKYLEESGGEKCFDREKEFHLAELWAAASVKARHLSQDMAVRLNEKAGFWSDQFAWSHEEVMSRRIDIKSIAKQFNDLLKKT